MLFVAGTGSPDCHSVAASDKLQGLGAAASYECERRGRGSSRRTRWRHAAPLTRAERRSFSRLAARADGVFRLKTLWARCAGKNRIRSGPARRGGADGAAAGDRFGAFRSVLAAGRAAAEAPSARARQSRPRLSRDERRRAPTHRGGDVGQSRAHLRRVLSHSSDHRGRPDRLRAAREVRGDRSGRPVRRVRGAPRKLGNPGLLGRALRDAVLRACTRT